MLLDTFGPDPVDLTVPGLPEVDLTGFYEGFAAEGVDYGPAFRGVAELRRRDRTATGVVRLPDGEAADSGCTRRCSTRPSS
ncbi:polyketide synthase dehydratase domain-containing protein [Actinomadura keratinilytica]